MNFELILGLLLTMMPITELRVGLPIVLNYALKNNYSVASFFILVLILNILVIFLVFLFFDFFHSKMLRFKWYSNFFEKKVSRVQKKSLKLQERFNKLGYLALTLFVAVPLPLTGAWTGTLLAWLLKFDRRKSIFAISIGVAIAGIIILFVSLGAFSIF